MSVSPPACLSTPHMILPPPWFFSNKYPTSSSFLVFITNFFPYICSFLSIARSDTSSCHQKNNNNFLRPSHRLFRLALSRPHRSQLTCLSPPKSSGRTSSPPTPSTSPSTPSLCVPNISSYMSPSLVSPHQKDHQVGRGGSASSGERPRSNPTIVRPL